MPRRLHTGGYTAVLAFALIATGPAAAESEISYRQAELMASTCFACHATDGLPDHEGPVLGGRPAEATLSQLRAFREGQVPGTTIMNRIAAGYTLEELEAIAAYFAVINPDRD